MKTTYLWIFILILAIISLLSLLFEPLLLLLHGISRTVFEGMSFGKTLLMVSWFVCLSLISLFFLYSGLYKKLEKFKKISLKLFFFFVILGFALGMVQYYFITLEFNSQGPFATILQEGNYSNWEASKWSHTHFPKATLYWASQFLPFSLKKYDDGKPWYNVLPNADEWAILYSAVIVFVLIFGLIHLASRIKEMDFLDYLLFSSAFLGFFIGIIDGGAGAIVATIALWAFLVYFVRNYAGKENQHSKFWLFFPLIAISLLAYFDTLFGFALSPTLHVFSFVLFFSLLYYFWKEKGIKKSKFNYLAFALLIYSGFVLGSYYLDYSFGMNVEEKGAFDFSSPEMSGAGLYLYGLPLNLSEKELATEIKKFGEIIELKKVNWVAYARIKPYKTFRTGELERALINKYNPTTYLIVESEKPFFQTSAFEIRWLTKEQINPEEFIPEKFLDLEVTGMKHNEKKNSTFVVIKSKTSITSVMLSLLTQIRENGYKGKIILASK